MAGSFQGAAHGLVENAAAGFEMHQMGTRLELAVVTLRRRPHLRQQQGGIGIGAERIPGAAHNGERQPNGSVKRLF